MSDGPCPGALPPGLQTGVEGVALSLLLWLQHSCSLPTSTQVGTLTKSGKLRGLPLEGGDRGKGG